MVQILTWHLNCFMGRMGSYHCQEGQILSRRIQNLSLYPSSTHKQQKSPPSVCQHLILEDHLALVPCRTNGRNSQRNLSHLRRKKLLLRHWEMSGWKLETRNCPIAKSYRAVSGVLPLMATSLQPPRGMKLRCPPAVVAARAALARTALVKTLRPQPLSAKMLVIALLGMAVNVPLGMWTEHTQKFTPMVCSSACGCPLNSHAQKVSADAQNSYGIDHWSFYIRADYWLKS